MKTISKSIWNFIKMHKFWSVVITLVILGIVWKIFLSNGNTITPAFAVVERGTVREEVSVTGNVKPLSDADLAFERGGRVANINVAVGDRVYTGQVLASVSNADLSASLDQVKANLKKVTAVFGDTALQASLDLTQAEISLVNAIKDSYTKADDAVRNKMFSLFDDPIKYNASLSFSTDIFLQAEIEDGKDQIVAVLNTWYDSLTKLNSWADLKGYYNTAKTNLISIKSLLDKSAEAVNGLSPEADGVTQTEIDTWKANISTARTNINTAIDTLTSSFDSYNTASLSVRVSQNSTLAEEASIEQARAQVASAEAELAKTIIKSPIAGVITKIDMELGEIIPANKNIMTVISAGDYEVESFVPEADVSKVKTGDLAHTTLDAYGDSVVFETSVIKIDPAATIIDGVPTYKVTLKFSAQDERVRSGMTANLDILTAEKADVLVVPTRAVIAKNGDRSVKVLKADNSTEEVKVQVGLRGSDGQTEIVSGLIEGDKVVTN